MLDCDLLLALPIITLENGKQVGNVKKLVYDAQHKTLAALVVEEHRNPAYCKVLPFEHVNGIGSYAVTISSEKNLQMLKNSPQLFSLFKQKTSLKRCRVISENGQLLGSIEKIYIDTDTGQLAALEMSGSLLTNMVRGNCLLLGQFIKTIGQSTVISSAAGEKHLQPAPTKLQTTFTSIKSGGSSAWETSKRWAHSLGKAIQEVTADEPPDDDNKNGV